MSASSDHPKQPTSTGPHQQLHGKKSSAERKTAPTPTLPKGGGAIKGIGEKFAANPVTGTGSMTIPIATSPGRSGFGPELNLSYDSGSGNGEFGFGWNLALPSITRKTDKGIPRYLDDEESDVFILSEAEDLVPVMVETPSGWQREDLPTRNVGGEDFKVVRYRPRVERLFSRIERWTSVQSGETHWRSITRDNITTLYGKDDNSRVFSPPDTETALPKRVFSWLICETFDDKGNVIVYDYVAENDESIDPALVSERRRSRGARRYVRSIKYGNRVSGLLESTHDSMDWMFEVVFDYDEGRYEDLPLEAGIAEDAQHRFAVASLAPRSSWSARPDPFSVYRSAFEVRTYRRCHHVLMFHRFPELGTDPCLVRSTTFDYVDLDYSTPATIQQELDHQGSTRFASFIGSVTQSGFTRDGSPAVEIGGVNVVKYLKRSLPPVELKYSKSRISDEIKTLDNASLENLPIGLGVNYRWVDLNGEGVSGILTEQADNWCYKPNLGAGRFGPLQPLPSQPAFSNLSDNRHQLLDLAGNGQLDLVTFKPPAPGFYERTPEDNWTEFKAFSVLPNVDWDEPNLRFIDLNGDGHSDILITEDDLFTWYPSLAEHGFRAAVQVAQAFDEEHGARLVFADRTQSIYLADMSGDGLTDIVRIRNGEIAYWPNLGYARFGAKITMDHAPWFDNEDQFNQARIRVADVDGSGTSDIIYLGRTGARIFFNQSGNRWSDPRELSQFPPIDNLTSVTTADLLANGTSCLVWSTPLPDQRYAPLRYIDLTETKPHLLIGCVNNLGAETRVEYASSTKFYLADKQAGKPWITKLPFPVHVVERIESYDRVSGNRFVTRYDYHHGYFDGVEREFRGFGSVEQRDTEEFAALNTSQQFPGGTNIDESSHVPPVLTRTWYHTGIHLGREHVSDFFAGLLNEGDAGEYYREPGLTDEQTRELLLDDTVVPGNLTVEEEREACRALRGMMLRQEVFALDGTPEESHPYTVTEQNFAVEVIQPQGENRHCVIFTHPCEAINYHYERKPNDPRVTHALTLEVDPFGNVLKEANVAYGRRETVLVVDDDGAVQETPNPGLAQLTPADQEKQTATLIIYNEHTFSNPIAEVDDYRTPLPVDSRTYEITGLAPTANSRRLTFTEIADAGTGAAVLNYENSPTAKVLQKRLIEHSRTIYRRNDLSGALALNVAESLALLFETYQLALSPGLVTSVYDGRVTNQMIETDAGYVHSEGDNDWWIPSGLVFYSPDPSPTPPQELAHARSHFFLPCRYRDPFHTDVRPTETIVTFDVHDLLVLETRDALGNRVTAGERDSANILVSSGLDYRVLQPRLVMGPNRNCSEAAFDALGMVAATSVRGKPDEIPPRGDLITNSLRADLTQAEIDQFFAAPRGPAAASLLDQATTRLVYDLSAFWHSSATAERIPVYTAALVRETHVSDLAPGKQTEIQVTFSYSDGFGREIQKKIPAEAGPSVQRDATGQVITGTDGQPIMTSGDVEPRWVGSGWTVFNNKGKPVRQYEPYFTDTHRFEFDVRIGVSSILFYDPTGRVISTLHPNHTWEKTVFDPWRQETWDVNDTVLIADPTLDPDVSDFFSRLPGNDYLPSWRQQRNGGQLGPLEQSAASKAAIHANTPAIAHFDSLGRTFLSIAHNRFKLSNSDPLDPPLEEFHVSRIMLDIEGNQREVRDAIVQNGDQLGRIVCRYDYDMLGGRIHQSSMEAGERWMLNDVAGKPLFAWDSRDNQFRARYDQLRRPAESVVRQGSNSEVIVTRTIYGESLANPEVNNLRSKPVQVFDQAGVVTSGSYDFKGNALQSERQFAQDYRSTVNWSNAVPLESEVFVSETTYDALNRPTSLVSPDHTNIVPRYNEANLLERVDVNLRGSAESTAFVTDIDYDAKGHRKLIVYGNRVRTVYEHDPLTFRLVRLLTQRDVVDFPDDCPQPPLAEWPGCQVQDLNYTYDPVGNVTHIRDDAQQRVYFRNQRVDSSGDYTYDALYRLIEATGREHLGQIGASPLPGSYNDNPRVRVLLSASDGNAMSRYLERYIYDAVGNLNQIIHRGSDPASPGWTRNFFYNEASQIEAAKQSNRLTSTTVGTTTETYSSAGDGYDAHGNMLTMPQLQIMQWDFKDHLQMTQRQAVDADDEEGLSAQAERTWYVYDSTGQRVRKVTDRPASAGATPRRRKERLYVGRYEVYREYQNDGAAVSLEKETLHVMDDKQRIALVETRTAGVEPGVPTELIRYQFSNHLGSASLELDQQAQIISYEEYYPFGSTSYQAVRSQTETPKRYRFTGKERDEESGFYYHGARYYAPWLLRWTSCDPPESARGANLYSYGAGNPIRFTDPDGKDEKNLVNDLLSKASQGYNKVRVRTMAEFGDVAKYYQQGASRYADSINRVGRLTEAEHPLAGAALRRLNPKFSYRAATTVVIDRAVAIAKTRGDLRLIERVKSRTLGAAEFAKLSKANFMKAVSTRWAQTGSQSVASVITDVKAAARVSEQAAQETLPALSAIARARARSGQAGFIDVGLMKGIAGGALTVATGALSYKELKEDLKKKDYGAALSSGAGVLASATTLGAKGAALFTGVSSVSLSAPVASLGGAKLIAAAPHVAAAFAVGAGVGVALEKTLDVSAVSSSVGMKADAAVKQLGGGEGLRTAAGVTATILSTPASLGIAAVDKVAGGRLGRFLGLRN